MSGRHSSSPPFFPGSAIGVLGSGQLGRMFAIAARRMGYRVHTFSPDEDTPTGQVADRGGDAPYDDLDAVASSRARLGRHLRIRKCSRRNRAAAPNARPSGQLAMFCTSLSTGSGKKLSLQARDFRSHPSGMCETFEVWKCGTATRACPPFRRPPGFGYDGKGQFTIHTGSELSAAWKPSASRKLYSRLYRFQREVSVVAARSEHGEFVHFRCRKTGIVTISWTSPSLPPVFPRR